MRQVKLVRKPPAEHWVGDGFPVRTIFSYQDLAGELSPFLMLDYGGPVEFAPTTERRGVGEHPHRGFETVTIVFDGEVEHRDSAGGGGLIGPGDVQWMTAGSGLLHEEFHGTEYARRGGRFEMMQLWVNLPKKDKLTAPRYQALRSADFPLVALEGGQGTVRVIAGHFGGKAGPAKTFSPLDVLDVRLAAGAKIELPVTSGWTSAVVVRRGAVRVNGSDAKTTELVVLEGDGSVALEASEACELVLLAGAPLREPIVGYGPFVMTSREEIIQAVEDFQAGRMGRPRDAG